ncbi:hypothetical protein F5884DRAFT_872762 [Xylogone sp. PMI_703]|nr:hypothetical protein F5884DRAFT_872762 [Xylogone sp. PMI_703]
MLLTMKFFQRPIYQHVSPDEEGSTSSSDKELPSNAERSTTRISKTWKSLNIVRLDLTHCLFFICLALLVSLFWVTSIALRLQTLQACLKQTDGYSPAFEAVELYDTQFSNAFNKRNEYIGPPTLEREEAWFRLWKQAEILVPEDQMVKLNISGHMLDDYMKAPEEEEQGIGYVGGLEVFHQLHCLFTWFLMDKYNEDTLPAEFKYPLKVLRVHTDHCIETLRLTLMCHSDVTPVLVRMDHDHDPPEPQADFNVHHRCRNFDRIVEWNRRNGLSIFGNVNHRTHHDHDHEHNY